MSTGVNLGIPDLSLSLDDFKTPERFQAIKTHLDRIGRSINYLLGLHGPITLQSSLNMKGNSITNVASPVNASDVVTKQSVVTPENVASIGSQLEATGNNPLQTVRRLSDTAQQEQFSTFMNSQISMVPVSNTSTISVVAGGGGTSTVTVSGGNLLLADKSILPYAQRSDTFTNPGSGSNFYFYFVSLAAKALQFIGPFSANTPQNQIAAQYDGRAYIGTAQVNAAGGGSGGGGGGGTPGACYEIGTPVAIPEGKIWSMEVLPCSRWVVIDFKDGRRLSAAVGTQIAVLKRVQDLEEDDICVDQQGQSILVNLVHEEQRESFKMKMKVEGRMYYANGILTSNFKPNQ